jgi:hypothetical protein
MASARQRARPSQAPRKEVRPPHTPCGCRDRPGGVVASPRARRARCSSADPLPPCPPSSAGRALLRKGRGHRFDPGGGHAERGARRSPCGDGQAATPAKPGHVPPSPFRTPWAIGAVGKARLVLSEEITGSSPVWPTDTAAARGSRARDAGVAQWQSGSLPNCTQEFDSPRPLEAEERGGGRCLPDAMRCAVHPAGRPGSPPGPGRKVTAPDPRHHCGSSANGWPRCFDHRDAGSTPALRAKGAAGTPRSEIRRRPAGEAHDGARTSKRCPAGPTGRGAPFKAAKVGVRVPRRAPRRRSSAGRAHPWYG